MRTPAVRPGLRLLGLAWLLGCGSGATHPVAEPAEQPASAGAEDAAQPQDEPPQSDLAAEEPPPSKAGPATVAVNATVRGQPVGADVRLMREDGSEAATGRSGEPISVQSGEYTLLVTITDEAALLDKPTQRRPLAIQAGDSLKESVDFPWAVIQLNVRINGKQDSGALVELSRQGAVVGTLKSGADPVPISPGRYDAQVKARGATIPVQGLMFPQGATQSMPVNVQM